MIWDDSAVIQQNLDQRQIQRGEEMTTLKLVLFFFNFLRVKIEWLIKIIFTPVSIWVLHEIFQGVSQAWHPLEPVGLIIWQVIFVWASQINF